MLKLRDAVAQDSSLILSFVRELANFEREPNAVIATEADLLRDGFSRHPKFRAVVAELDGDPAGMALFFHHYSTWQGRAGIFVEDLIIKPRYRDKGVGKALMSHLAKIALQEGCYGMRWEVHSWNKQAITFYQRLGAEFREHGRVMPLKDMNLKKLAVSRSPGVSQGS